jgi:O-antigen ligase
MPRAIVKLISLVLFSLLALSLALSISLVWVLVVLLAVVLLGDEDFRRNWKSEGAKILEAPLTVPIVIYCSVLFCSGCFAEGGFSLKEGFASLGVGRGFLIYFLALPFFQGERRTIFLPWAVTCFLAICAVSGIFAAIQQVFNFHPFTYPYLQATGFLSSPMPFAGLMQVASFLALGFLAAGAHKKLPGFLKNKAIFTMVVALNFLGLIFASERSAWLGMVLTLAVFFATRSWRQFFVGVLVLCLSGVLAYSFIPVVKVRMEPLLAGKKDVGVADRLKIWQVAGQSFREKPVLGVGPRKFPRLELPESIVPGHSKDINHAHSNYLHVLATTGSVGFLAFAYLLLASLYLAFSTMRHADLADNINQALGLGLFLGLVSLAVAGVFEYNFGSGQVRLIQWFWLAALLPLVDKHDSLMDENHKTQI